MLPPLPAETMPLTSSLVIKNVDRTLRLITASRSAMLVSVNKAGLFVPALLMSIS